MPQACPARELLAQPDDRFEDLDGLAKAVGLRKYVGDRSCFRHGRAALKAPHAGPDTPSHQGFCGARWNRTTDLSIISAAAVTAGTVADQHVYPKKNATQLERDPIVTHRLLMADGVGAYPYLLIRSRCPTVAPRLRASHRVAFGQVKPDPDTVGSDRMRRPVARSDGFVGSNVGFFE